MEGNPNQPMARPSRHGRYDARKESISSEELPSVSVLQYLTSEDVSDQDPYTMFERPKTSHGRRASTGTSIYHETKSLQRDYQYPDTIEKKWDQDGRNQHEEHVQELVSYDEEVEIHDRNHRRPQPIKGDVTEHKRERFERPSSRRGYPRQGRQLVDCGLDNPRRGSFDEESYLPSQPTIIQEPAKRLRPKSAKHNSHKKPVFDVPIMRPPSSLTRFQPLPSIGSKCDHIVGEMDRLVLHADKVQLEDDVRDPMSTDLKMHGHDTRPEARCSSAYSERTGASQHHKTFDHEFEKNSKPSHGFQYKEGISDHLENHDVHQENDSSKKSDSKTHHSWSKHSPRNHSSKDKSRYEDQKLKSSPRGERKRQLSISPEPSEDENRWLLAVKLPEDGRRFQRYFRPLSSLRELIRFAEYAGNVDLSDYSIACNAPRKVFTDFHLTCQEVGLQDRTLLYFEKTDL